MSLLNVFPGRDRVLFITDTAAALVAAPQALSDPSACTLDFETRGASKIATLAHAGAVVAGRGNLLFLNVVLYRLFAETDRDFDGLCNRLAAICNDAAKSIATVALAHGFKAANELGEVVMAGWSRSRKAIRTVAVFNDDAVGRAELFDLVEPWITPSLDDFPAFPASPSIAEVQRLTIQQVLHFRGLGESCLGGSMVMCELTARGARFDWGFSIEREAARLAGEAARAPAA